MVFLLQYYSLFNHFQNNPWALLVCSTSLLKTLWKKEKLLVYPFGELSANLIKFEIVVCKLFQFGPVQNIITFADSIGQRSDCTEHTA